MNDPIIITLVAFVVALLFLASGMHVGIALALTGILGFAVFRGSVNIASYVLFDSTNNFTLTAVPLFIFMGEILLRSGASEMIYRGTSRWFAWVPGGLLHSNIASCALFAAISGSSPATAATIGTVAIPSLKKRGYDMRMTLGSLAAGGTLGILIPPSINMIVYGMIANQSVGRLFIGGVVPGIILSLIFMIYIGIRAVHNRQLAPKEAAFSIKDALLGIVDVWPIAFLGTIVLGGIFVGLVTPTEAAALGASGALLIALGLRRFSWQSLRGALISSLAVSCMVMFIYVGAMILTSFFGVMGMPKAMAALIAGSDIGKYQLLAAVYLLYVILGCFIDGISAMVLTVPTIVPILVMLGFDPIWFGVVLVVLVELGMITPPMGLNLFVIQGISQRPLEDVIRGVAPYFGLMFICIALLTAFPWLVLWLPSLMMGQ